MGYQWLHILSAEGRHHPLNASISGEEYEASRAAVLDMLRAQRPPIPPDRTEREQILGECIIGIQKLRHARDARRLDR